MKKIGFTALLLVLALAIVTAPVSAGGPTNGTRVYGHNILIQVEPIEVTVESISNTVIRPGQSVTVMYAIANYATSNQVLYATQATGIKSQWFLGSTEYLPGSTFLIAGGQRMQLKVIFWPTSIGEVPAQVDVWRVTGNG